MGHDNDGWDEKIELNVGENEEEVLARVAPYLGPALIDAHNFLLDRAQQWRAEGVKADLDLALILVAGSGPAISASGEPVPLMATAKGAHGATPEPEEVINALHEALVRTIDAADYQNPFKKFDAHQVAIAQLGIKIKAINERWEQWPQRLWRMLPSKRRENELREVVAAYIEALGKIEKYGGLPHHEDATPLDTLSRKDFEPVSA